MAMMNKQSQVPLQQQQLLYNGKEMKNAETLSGLGVTDGDLVMMVSNAAASSRCDFLFTLVLTDTISNFLIAASLTL